MRPKGEAVAAPGGKPDAGETDIELLVRELDEELGVRPVDARVLAHVESVAVLEGVPLRLTVFTAGLSSTPHPAAEDHVLPLLKGNGMPAA
ncbi:NUDIX domain-containing protein [Streptomyces sp. LaPpAH-108]|uniref:NUDIX domain-containing protein n=1 Tax=Streptomyces sp. LaPpAH-108 TaxID=1155714 RepID=UPI00037E676F|nr:NUDIX domain-containing protein [Streptomyces sp. LaPpAH-108]